MITKKLMERLFPTKGLNSRRFNLVTHRDDLIDTMNRILPKYGIDSYLRICAFLGNCGIETDYFRTTEEYASGADYEGRANLGNFLEGDGRRFKGRDCTQTTGRFNYWRVTCRFVKKLTGRDFSKDLRKYRDFEEYLKSADYDALLKEADRMNVNFLEHPEKLAEIRFAVETACIFWDENNLNAYADRGQFKELSAIVNRGDKNKTPLHWTKRSALYELCLKVVPKDFSFSKPAAIADIAAPTATVDNSPAASTNPVDTATNPVVLPPTEPAATEPAKDDSFLASAVDRNVSADELRTTARTAAPRILARFSRPFLILYAMLEAGNVYAWFGVAVGVIGLGLLIYWHRADLKKVFQTIKTKILQ
jgi:predicted chitinase